MGRSSVYRLMQCGDFTLPVGGCLTSNNTTHYVDTSPTPTIAALLSTNISLLRYAASVASPTLWARADSATCRSMFSSAHQSLKDDRKP